VPEIELLDTFARRQILDVPVLREPDSVDPRFPVEVVSRISSGKMMTASCFATRVVS